MNMLGLSSSVHFAHTACYWNFFLLHYAQVLCQYRLYRADHAYLTYLMLQRQLSHFNGLKLDHRQVWTERSHVSSLYNFGKNRIEITTSNSSSIILCLFVVAETCIENRCLAMDVSAVLLWLRTFGVQALCHNIIRSTTPSFLGLFLPFMFPC
jgi:hypothetical protein